MTQEISEPRLKRIGRALLRGEEWASEDADRAGLGLDEVIHRAREVCAPKPKKPVGRSKRDLLAIINEHYEPRPYGPVKPVPIKSLNHIFLMVEAMKALHIMPGKRGARSKKLTDGAAYERFVAAIGEPTKPFSDKKSDIPINANHLKNLRYRMDCDRRCAAAERAERWERIDADRRLVAGQDHAHGADVIFTNGADRARQREAWLSNGT